ncbi:MAG: hypothetical protein NXI31_07915 [bacterium]|nr:hypothetical protein [bacterium]
MRRAVVSGHLLLALILLGAIASGCVSRIGQVERYAALAPTRYVVVLPAQRASWPCVQRFLAWKSAQGYAVETVTIPQGGTRSSRFTAVSEALERRRPKAGECAYVLLLATPRQLPMGAWKLHEDERGTLSDWPLLAGVRDRHEVLEDVDWLDTARYPQRWIPGRIPFGSYRTVAAALRAAERYAARSTRAERSALLGAERFGVPFDSSLILDAVRETLREGCWDTRLLSEDVPRDAPIAGHIERIERLGKTVFASEATINFTFLREWATAVPDLVYVIAHSTLLTIESEVGQDRWFGIGKRAIDPISYLVYRAGGHSRAKAPKTPSSPAILVATGCQVARPDNRLIDALFRDGWIAGYCGSTTDTGPLPPAAAVRAELRLPYYLARGLPIGVAMLATADAYLTESAWDPLTTLLRPWAEPMRRQNVLSWVFYGDPSLQLANRDRFHPHGPLRPK